MGPLMLLAGSELCLLFVFPFPASVGLTHSSTIGWNPYAESYDYKKKMLTN